MKQGNNMGLDTWSPLFGSIVGSSIWGEKLHVRVVWITMIALKDKDGLVCVAMDGLRRFANVTPEECEEAVRIMESPDKESKCSAYEGRKIKRVEGGWLVLGHERYQKKMKEISLKIGNAKRQAKHRAKGKSGPLPGETAAVKAFEDGLVDKDGVPTTPPAQQGMQKNGVDC